MEKIKSGEIESALGRVRVKIFNLKSYGELIKC